MPKKRPTKTCLPKEKIADAIGDKLKISENLKRRFADELVKELDDVFAADGSAYPDKAVANPALYYCIDNGFKAGTQAMATCMAG